jgi:ParB family chromosome partitioning protein
MNKFNSLLGLSVNKQQEIIEKIPVELISRNPFQPRQVFDNEHLEELASSIKQYGVLQPIILKKISSREYTIIAGERRFRAAKLAGLTEIPSIIKDLDESEMAEIAIIENLQRENLNYFEEAEGFKVLAEQFDMTQEEIAKKVGKSQSMVANKIRLLKLSPKVRQEISTEVLSERHLRALIRIPEEENQLMILGKIYENNLNVKQTEELINNFCKNGKTEEKKEVLSIKASKPSDYKLFQNTLKKSIESIEFLGARAEYSDVLKDDHLEVIIKIYK